MQLLDEAVNYLQKYAECGRTRVGVAKHSNGKLELDGGGCA